MAPFYIAGKQIKRKQRSILSLPRLHLFHSLTPSIDCSDMSCILCPPFAKKEKSEAERGEGREKKDEEEEVKLG